MTCGTIGVCPMQIAVRPETKNNNTRILAIDYRRSF
jgi:hypothetical protein